MALGSGDGRTVSIHAPLRREERHALQNIQVVLHGFNPRPPPKRGATALEPVCLVGLGYDLFQSTPPSEERSDATVLGHVSGGRHGFQSTPPSEERSDPIRQQCWMGFKVSIHAPLRREERRATSGYPGNHRCFNPRPPPKRGATLALRPQQAAERFQSTPPSEERSDGCFRWRDLVTGSFQSTPPSEERSDHSESSRQYV